MKLVIVDGYATIRRLLRGKLEAEGHTTLEAGDGIEALEILGREKVDAVVSDILMPRMDGYRLCHEIRMNERLRKLPFVIYTATYTSASDEELADATLPFLQAKGFAADAELRAKLIAAMPGLKERAKTLVELADSAYFLVAKRPLVLDEKAAKLLTPDARARAERHEAVGLRRRRVDDLGHVEVQ